MKTIPVILTGLLLAAASLHAQPAPKSASSQVRSETLTAWPNELLLLPALKAVHVLAAPPTAQVLPSVPEGVHAADVPLLQNAEFAREMAHFIGQPVSSNSLERLQNVIRIHLELRGRPLARVFTPPQDITDGILRVVVQLATLDGDIQITGNRWFARDGYINSLSLRRGAVVDSSALREDIAWLGRNPYRRVSPQLEAGSQPGTTRLSLRAEERFPATLNTAYSNTGTALTDEDRVSVGLQWGNAFGRGDLFNYNFSGDPGLKYMRSHSGGYTTFLPWRHVLSLTGAYSKIDSAMPIPFSQHGTLWQAGARYEIPLRPLRQGWNQNLSFSADFKYSDNTLEFVTIPVTDNATHIAQMGATYGVSFRALGGQNSVSISGYASPGGLTHYNKTRAFEGSRAGAKSDYVYGRFNVTHQRPLWRGFSSQTNLDAQFASGALLGSEQITGGGAYGVRGYRDSSAFGDKGVVVNNELHAPAFNLLHGQDSLDLFAFVDGASLNLNIDNESTDLRSVGFGLNYHWHRHVSLRASYGWQLKYLDRSTDKARAHLGANFTW